MKDEGCGVLGVSCGVRWCEGVGYGGWSLGGKLVGWVDD